VPISGSGSVDGNSEIIALSFGGLAEEAALLLQDLKVSCRETSKEPSAQKALGFGVALICAWGTYLTMPPDAEPYGDAMHAALNLVSLAYPVVLSMMISTR
jgi:hypothetical protein